jgi:hypothetical protein
MSRVWQVIVPVAGSSSVFTYAEIDLAAHRDGNLDTLSYIAFPDTLDQGQVAQHGTLMSHFGPQAPQFRSVCWSASVVRGRHSLPDILDIRRPCGADPRLFALMRRKSRSCASC